MLVYSRLTNSSDDVTANETLFLINGSATELNGTANTTLLPFLPSTTEVPWSVYFHEITSTLVILTYFVFIPLFIVLCIVLRWSWQKFQRKLEEFYEYGRHRSVVRSGKKSMESGFVAPILFQLPPEFPCKPLIDMSKKSII